MRDAETASMPVPELQGLGTKQAGNLMPLIIGFRCQEGEPLNPET